LNAIGAQFNNSVWRHLGASGLDVYHHEIEFFERAGLDAVCLQFDSVPVKYLEAQVVSDQIGKPAGWPTLRRD
jgi:hypothetical protein